MNMFAGKTIRLSIAALASTLALGVPQAGAQGLFDTLFGGGIRRQQERQEFPPAPVRRKAEQKQVTTTGSIPKKVAKASSAEKITGPSYYTYRADALRPIDFSTLAAIGQSASLDERGSGTAFREAAGDLAGYELFAEADIATALTDFYKANPDFLWVTDGAANDRAREAVRVLGEAAGHGLVPIDYSVSIPTAGANSGRSDAIRFEMALSARLLRYVEDATNGRVDPNRLSGYHDLPRKPIDLAATLQQAAVATDMRAWLESHHPQSPQYKQLRVELEALNASAENDIVVDPKLLLKPGESSPELTKLLQLIARDLDDEMGGAYGEVLARLGASETYGDELVPVIRAVQKKQGLKPDGVIGPRTVALLAGTSKADRLRKVEVALEQMRWLPSELGSPRVFINQPAYTASYIDGADELKMRVVIGRTANQTTFFYDKLQQVDYNPYWGVPQSIIVNEMLPRLRRDPGYLDRAGYEVTDAKGRRVSSSAVNWGQYGSKVPYSVRQTPSEANALGELKILFPNKHAIYMHDTPQKELFKRDERAFSHGCVRLADPRAMAAAVLGTSVEHVADKLKQGHSTEKVTRSIPVYVAYFTAWPDMSGKVEYFGDVYDRDTRVQAAFDKIEGIRSPSS